jgi:hypothetical protein
MHNSLLKRWLVLTHFRAIIRPVYQYPRMFWAIFGPSSDLYIRTHECSGPFSGHHQTCISEPTNVPGHFRAIIRRVYNNNNLLTASGLSPGGSGYFTFNLCQTY